MQENDFQAEVALEFISKRPALPDDIKAALIVGFMTGASIMSAGREIAAAIKNETEVMRALANEEDGAFADGSIKYQPRGSV